MHAPSDFSTFSRTPTPPRAACAQRTKLAVPEPAERLQRAAGSESNRALGTWMWSSAKTPRGRRERPPRHPLVAVIRAAETASRRRDRRISVRRRRVTALNDGDQGVAVRADWPTRGPNRLSNPVLTTHTGIDPRLPRQFERLC
jgi:hypothetical protein